MAEMNLGAVDFHCAKRGIKLVFELVGSFRDSFN